MLHEPHGVEAHLVGQDALLDGLLDDGVVVKGGPLHLVLYSQLHWLLLPT